MLDNCNQNIMIFQLIGFCGKISIKPNNKFMANLNENQILAQNR